MDLNINNNISKNNNIHENFIKDFSSELKNSLNENLFSIDRFEDNYAICENKKTGEFVNISKDLLPIDCKEGDILKLENGIYIIDKEKTQSEQEEVKRLVDNLFKKKN